MFNSCFLDTRYLTSRRAGLSASVELLVNSITTTQGLHIVFVMTLNSL